MSQPVAFLPAAFGVCTGIAVFKRLCRNSWWRVIAHFLLWSALVALLTAAFQFYELHKVWTPALRNVEAAFPGGIVFSPGKILPAAFPADARQVVLPGYGVLAYHPGLQADFREPVPGTERYRVDWCADGLTFQLLPEQRVELKLKKLDDQRTELVMTEYFRSEPREILPDVALEWPMEKVSWTPLFWHALAQAATALWLGHWLMSIFLTLLYPTVFVGISRLTGARQLRSIGLAEYWKIGIYAAFPALLIASAFTALRLPWLSFETVYIIGTLIYWMYVTARLERESESDGAGEK